MGRTLLPGNVAERLLQIAGVNMPLNMMTNACRLQELTARGLHLKVASSHGVNNCLIDSLLLCLVNKGLTPQEYTMAERKALCATCPEDLCVRHGVPRGVYLDGHRDTPRILDLFVRRLWKLDVSVRVFFYDCMDHGELGMASTELSHVDFTWGDRVVYERQTLHVYNHTDPTGQGYHFDALVGAVAQRGNQRKSCARGSQAHTTEDEGSRHEDRGHRPPSMELQRVHQALDGFFRSRGTGINVNMQDARDIMEAWDDAERCSVKLHMLLQANTTYMDAGMHAARRLLGQWRAHYATCTQAPGQRLGESMSGKGGKKEVEPAAEAEAMEVEEAVASNRQKPSETEATDKDASSTGTKAAAKRPLADALGLPRKRLRGKQPAPEQGLARNDVKGDDALDHGLGLDEYILRTWHATHGNPDPRAQGDMVLEALGKQFRKKPTLPHWMAIATRDAAFDLPDYICSFEGCNFESDLAEAFEEHICQEHRRALEPLASKPATKAKMLEAYRAGLTWACQQDAPTAHIAIDRRCLRQYRDSQSGDKIGAGICLLCARRFPYADAMGEGDRIQWKQLAGKSHFLGLSLEETKRWLSLDTYWSTYAMQYGRTVRERLRAELQDWCADVELDGQNLSIICCPEDKVCAKRCPPGRICSACWAPVCMHCWDSLRAKEASRLALANDMLVFYTPRLIYKEEVTFMELVCASPCFTAMACFSLEKKLLGDRALDQDALMNRNRLVARGNATTFPLAWEELLQNLQAASTEAAAGEIRLPKVGVIGCGNQRNHQSRRTTVRTR